MKRELFTRYIDHIGDGSGQYDMLYKLADSTVTFTNATNKVNLTAHGYLDGFGPFQLSNSGGALPTGLAADTDYYIANKAADTFELATSRANALAGTSVAFSDDGSGTNTIETPMSFFLKPESGYVYACARMIVHIMDTGNFALDKYGVDLTLTNGITVKKKDVTGTLITDLLGGETVIDNTDWSHVAYDVRADDYGVNIGDLTVRWTFAKYGAPLILNGDDGDYLEVNFHDDFAALTGHEYIVEGIKMASRDFREEDFWGFGS